MSEYFEARGVSPETYKKTSLPAYFKEAICQLPPNARILDFGCGFGQNLLAIKERNFNFIDSSGGGGAMKLVYINLICLGLTLTRTLLPMCKA